jgi:hypothetical protein
LKGFFEKGMLQEPPKVSIENPFAQFFRNEQARQFSQAGLLFF